MNKSLASMGKLILSVIVILAIGTGMAYSADTLQEDAPLVRVSGGIDLLYFKFYARQGAEGGPGNFDDYFPDMGSDACYRYWAHLQSKWGVGIRWRYFEYSESAFYLGRVREQAFEMTDVEATVDTNLGKFEILAFAGARFGEIELHGSDFGEPNPYQFDGEGFTLGLDVRRPIVWGFSLIGGVRYSLLYGDVTFRPVSTRVLGSTTVDIIDVHAGLEWMKKFGSRFEVALAAGWEHQFYGTDTYFPFAIDPETLGDVSLGGPVFSASLKF